MKIIGRRGGGKCPRNTTKNRRGDPSPCCPPFRASLLSLAAIGGSSSVDRFAVSRTERSHHLAQTKRIFNVRRRGAVIVLLRQTTVICLFGTVLLRDEPHKFLPYTHTRARVSHASRNVDLHNIYTNNFVISFAGSD